MEKKQEARESVWQRLEKVARPDSRFHFDFSRFIPDFEGSQTAVKKLVELNLWGRVNLIFITPDNCLTWLRSLALSLGKKVLVPTYGLRRGIVFLDPRQIKSERREIASLLDGMEKEGKLVSLTDIQKLGSVDLLVTGASVVSTNGVRFGKGHGWFDLERALLWEIGVIEETTPVVVVVHDCQVIKESLEASSFDTAADLIITPTRVIQIENPPKPQVGIIWEKITPEMREKIPPLQELWKMRKRERG